MSPISQQGYAQAMESEPYLPPQTDPELPDQPEPLPPARGHGIVAERLISVNGLISVLMLSWALIALRNPKIPRRLIRSFWRRFPRIVGSIPPL
ncbi:MAG: hypothetical protein JWO59_1192 [Chloroflexi bacterium]|nr:hypothetical protein [Chloroflexota bacterium]